MEVIFAICALVPRRYIFSMLQMITVVTLYICILGSQVWAINYKHFFDPVHGSVTWPPPRFMVEDCQFKMVKEFKGS